MNLLSDVITYIRRIIKSPSDAVISDNLIIDYINRFWIMDVDARLQLFDLKTKYQFQTVPTVDKYNMPLYDVQIEPGGQSIASYPVYQGFMGPVYINGIQVPFYTQKNQFYNIFPNVVQNSQAIAVGNGGTTYTINLPVLGNSTPINPPINGILRGHVDITGIISTGANIDPPFYTTLNTSIPVTSTEAMVFITSQDANGNPVVVTDSGQFLFDGSSNQYNYGLLMTPGNAPTGNTALPGGYLNTFVITGITQANPGVFTSTTTLVVGQLVTISGVVGMTELNGNTYTVIAVTATTVTLGVDTSSFSPYVSGGVITAFQNVVNYLTGVINITFPVAIPSNVNINVQTFYFQSGLPRGVLFYNNTLIFRSPPSQAYLVELDAYLTPAAFLSTSNAVPFAYMSEYIARGAARKILADTGDVDQFQFYEPLFKEQELLVWKRSQRQFTATRTETIYSQGLAGGIFGFNALGGSTTL